LIGDKWSLIIIRDLITKKRRYSDFQQSPEGIPSNILASRLKMLETDGLIEKHVYQDKPVRYEYRLTSMGADLLPVLQTMALWGRAHLKERWAPPDWFMNARPSDLLE
jgi:DNA-binding HxlR family transcriptional regulator